MKQKADAIQSTRSLSSAGIPGAIAIVLVGCASSSQYHPAPVAKAPPAVVIPVPAPAPVVQRAPVRPPEPPAALVTSVTALVTQFSGIAGVAITSLDDGWTVEANARRRMPQQSVSKLWVAMTVLEARDQGRLSLNDPITITDADLTVFHQPVAALIGKTGYQTTIGELMRRALTMSDNTCNDRLLRYVGGPDAVRGFIARHGLGDIRFGPGEKLLQAGTAGLTWQADYSKGRTFEQARALLPADTRWAAFNTYVADPVDGAAPYAIANALAKLKRGQLLSPASTATLLGFMEESKTGKQRLRGAVPPGWTFGHKTGTGQDLGGHTAGYNDVGVLTAPDGKGYALAVMIAETGKPIPARQELMQAVMASIVANHRS